RATHPVADRIEEEPVRCAGLFESPLDQRLETSRQAEAAPATREVDPRQPGVELRAEEVDGQRVRRRMIRQQPIDRVVRDRFVVVHPLKSRVRVMADVERIQYDEFSLFHENAEEFGIPYDGPPVVRRETVEVEPGRSLSALVWGNGDPELVFLHG